MQTEYEIHRLISDFAPEKNTIQRKRLIHEINCINAELEPNARRRNVISIIKHLNSKDKLTTGIVKALYQEIAQDIRKKYTSVKS
jgi:hypothetical protein